MHHLIRTAFVIAPALMLSVCTAAQAKPRLSENLSFAPAIDVPYSEVNSNIEDNIGVNVRWGGQVISSTKNGDTVELTILANVIGQDGRPIPNSSTSENSENSLDERFILIVPNNKEPLLHNYISAYGQVSGEKTLANGSRTREIPIVTAIETKEWNSIAIRKQGEPSRGRGYYSGSDGYYLSRLNYSGLGYSGRSHRFNRFNHGKSFKSFTRFGHSKFKRGFKSNRSFGRRSFSRRGRH